MKKFSLFLLLSAILVASCSRNIYIVRHAEKAMMSDSLPAMSATDPPLSEPGRVRALVLRDELKNQHIKHIYSTNTIRTFTTAEPLSKVIGIPIVVYKNEDSLVNLILMEKGNALIVGHSNTVDDIVNKLVGEKKIAADLKDPEYDNLFIVKIKGKKKTFIQKKYGYPSNP
jgi:broad specificity phosphatase PhoE